MIILATLKDEVVEGQSRAAGKQLRQRVVFSVDHYNLVLAVASGSSPLMGKYFTPKLRMMEPVFADNGLDIKAVTIQIREVLCKLFGAEDKGQTLAEMDEEFALSSRTADSTGDLVLYRTLKEKGWNGGEDSEDSEDK